MTATQTSGKSDVTKPDVAKSNVTKPDVPKPDVPKPDAAPAADEAPADQELATTEPAGEPAKPKRGRPKGSVAKKAPTVELTLTVIGTAQGDWHAELRRGTTWVARELPVSAAAVLRAAKELHDDLATPINEAIQTARSEHQARVSALEAELEQARKALAELVD